MRYRPPNLHHPRSKDCLCSSPGQGPVREPIRSRDAFLFLTEVVEIHMLPLDSQSGGRYHIHTGWFRVNNTCFRPERQLISPHPLRFFQVVSTMLSKAEAFYGDLLLAIRGENEASTVPGTRTASLRAKAVRKAGESGGHQKTELPTR